MRLLVTGGAGFIGSHYVRSVLTGAWGLPEPDQVVVLDKLTYAGRRENLHDVMDDPRHVFVHGDIADAAVSGPLVEQSQIVVHFAAETHVDRPASTRSRLPVMAGRPAHVADRRQPPNGTGDYQRAR